jgi:hypothetical protein
MRRGAIVSGRCRLAGRALVVGVALLALPVMASSTANAVGEAQSLDLDPADGPPGATVTWVAEGFGDCPPADDAVPGGVVAVAWDGTDELERASVSDGSAVWSSSSRSPHWACTG